jgi:hypothetical protein
LCRNFVSLCTTRTLYFLCTPPFLYIVLMRREVMAPPCCLVTKSVTPCSVLNKWPPSCCCESEPRWKQWS